MKKNLYNISILGIYIYACLLASCSDTKKYTTATMSMAPTIKPKDTILVKPNAFKNIQDVKRFDIIKFQKYSNPIMRGPWMIEGNFLKRIIALPGDKIMLYKNHITINDKKLIIPLKLRPFYKNFLTFPRTEKFAESKYIYIVPKDSFFVIGDNITKGVDSRCAGFVKFKDITGKVVLYGVRAPKMSSDAN